MGSRAGQRCATAANMRSHRAKRVLPVDLHGDAARVGSNASAQGVADDLDMYGLAG
jgi:hypothetical protein